MRRAENVTPDDLKVLTFRQWCALASVSYATGKRILKSDNAPTICQLGDRRIGISLGAHRGWLERRARKTG